MKRLLGAMATIAAFMVGQEARPSTADDVTFHVRVCEASKGSAYINSEIGDKKCTTPITAAKVWLKTRGLKSRLTSTDSEGKAVVGPFAVPPGSRFQLVVESDTHDDLLYDDLRVGDGRVRPGANAALIFTTRAE